jgi:hypothetical protein
MHLKIDSLHFDGNNMGVDFEFDEDFRRQVAKACNVNHITKKDLQNYVVYTMKNVLSQEDISLLRQNLEN